MARGVVMSTGQYAQNANATSGLAETTEEAASASIRRDIPKPAVMANIGVARLWWRGSWWLSSLFIWWRKPRGCMMNVAAARLLAMAAGDENLLRCLVRILASIS